LKIGVDLHGTLTQSLKPNKEIIRILRKLERGGDEIIIVTSGRKQLNNLIKIWLWIFRVPYRKLFCTGSPKGEAGQGKLDVIKEEEIGLFIDNDEQIVGFLRGNSINALSVKELLG